MASTQRAFTTYLEDAKTKPRGWEVNGSTLIVHTLRLPITGTGMIQRCTACLDPDDGVDLSQVSSIYLFDTLKAVDEYPLAEAVIASNIIVLQRVEKHSAMFPFPFVSKSHLFAHIPVSPGLVYNADSTMSTEGGLHLWFQCNHTEPITISTFLRYYSFGS
jgi:hypothetical protein